MACVKNLSLRITNSVLLVALLGGSAGATDYYVSTTGLDTNPGTLAQPYATFQKAANTAGSGSNVYVMGGVYHEQVNVSNSGITFQPYANQAVTVTGLDALNATWSTYSGNTRQATVSTPVSQLFYYGRMFTEARFPNYSANSPFHATYVTADSATINDPPTNSTLTDSELGNKSNGYWTNSKMAIFAGDSNTGGLWALPATINGSTGNTLSYQWDTSRFPPPAYNPTAGNKYYLYGSLNTVDTVKEWYYDSSASQLYLNYGTGFNPSYVAVRTRQYAFNVTGSNNTVTGIKMNAASVLLDGNYNTVSHCQILYPDAMADPNPWNGPEGVNLRGQHNTLTASEVGFTWGNGVTASGQYSTVNDNVIHDVDWGGTDSAGINANNTDSVVLENNTIYNSGRSGILASNNCTNSQIVYNKITNYGILCKDLGGIYAWGGDNTGTEIAHNAIFNSRSSDGRGVYMDNGSSGATIHHNLVVGANVGITLNNPSSNEYVYNNTLWNVNSAMSAQGSGSLTNVNTSGNLSNDGSWVGSNIGHNLTTTDSGVFVQPAYNNYNLVGAADAWTAGAGWNAWAAGNQVAAPITSSIASVRQSDNAADPTGFLRVGNSTSTVGNDQRAFLKFDLSSVGFGAGDLVSAVLRLYSAVGDNQSGGVKLYKVTSDWNVDNISYGQSVDASSVISVTGSNLDYNLDLYNEIDVTSIVQAWLNDPSSNYGFSIRSDTEGSTNTARYFGGIWDSYDGSVQPQLILTHAPEPGSLALMGSAALVGLVVLVWRRRHTT